MKGIKIYTLLFLAFLIISCNNDVELLEKSAPVPVVYGLFNRSVDAQSLQISKTFVFGESGGATAAALVKDSVYYNPEDVVVQIISKTGQKVVAEAYNATDRGVVRDPGKFSVDGNWFYEYKVSDLDVKTGDSLSLVIEKQGEILAKGKALVLPTLAFTPSRPPTQLYPFSSTNKYSMRWDVERDNATTYDDLVSTYELGFDISVSETKNGVTTKKNMYWPAGTNLEPRSFQSLSIRGFYGFLSSQLVVDPEITRTLDYVSIVITAGDKSYLDYQKLIDANDGITSTQELPPFSNVEGGLGLFGGIAQLRQDTFGSLTPGAFQELNENPLTQPLNFKL